MKLLALVILLLSSSVMYPSCRVRHVFMLSIQPSYNLTIVPMGLLKHLALPTFPGIFYGDIEKAKVIRHVSGWVKYSVPIGLFLLGSGVTAVIVAVNRD